MCIKNIYVLCPQREDGFFHKTKVQHTSFTSWWCMRAYIMWLNMKYLSKMFWTHVLQSSFYRGQGDTQMMLKIIRFHIFRSVYIYKHEHTREHGCSFPFWGTPFIRKQYLFTPVQVTSVVCAYKRLEDGNKSRFGQIHCTVTYFIVLFLEGNLKNSSCLSVFCSFEQIALQCFYIQ